MQRVPAVDDQTDEERVPILIPDGFIVQAIGPNGYETLVLVRRTRMRAPIVSDHRQPPQPPSIQGVDASQLRSQVSVD